MAILAVFVAILAILEPRARSKNLFDGSFWSLTYLDLIDIRI